MSADAPAPGRGTGGRSELSGDVDRRARIGGGATPDPRWPWTVPVGRLGSVLEVDGRAPEALAASAVDRASAASDPSGEVAAPAFWQSASDLLLRRLRADLDPLLALLFASHRRRVGGPADPRSRSLHEAFFDDVLGNGGAPLWWNAPVAARRVAERVVRWEDGLRLLVEAFARGRGAHLGPFGVAQDDRLEAVLTHRGSAVAVRTSGGVALDHLARAAEGDVLWRDLLVRVDVGLPAPGVVVDPVSARGWRVGHVRAGDPDLDDPSPEVAHAYGALIGLVHAFGGHAEPTDLVGDGGLPVLDDPVSVLGRAVASATTVLDTGLVPRLDGIDTMVEMSVLRARGVGGRAPEVYEVTGAGTDAMSVRRRPGEVRGSASVGEWSTLARSAAVEGFTRAGGALRSVVATPDGRRVVERLVAATPRGELPGVVRAAVVATAAQDLVHPSALVDADDAASRVRRRVGSVARPDGGDLGGIRLAEVTAAVSEGVTGVQSRWPGGGGTAREVGERVQHDRWSAERSLLAAALDVRWSGPRERQEPLEASTGGLGARCTAAAVMIGRLVATHLRPDQPWTAVRRHMQSEDQGVGPLGLSLYGGVSGVVLLYAALAATTGDDAFAAVALDGVGQIERLLATPVQAPDEVGGVHGVAGAMYALAQTGLLLGREDLIDRGLGLTEALGLELGGAPLAAAGDLPELLGGRAGALLALSAVADAADQAGLPASSVASATGRARDLAAGLVAEAVEVEGGGVAWRGFAGPPLTGLSHGGSGIAWALARSHRRLDDPSLVPVIERWLVHEDTEFDRSIGNWVDRREEVAAGGELDAWCHGAAGIRLARSAIGDALDRMVPLPSGCVGVDRGRGAPTAGETGAGDEGGDRADWLCCGLAGRIAADLAGGGVEDGASAAALAGVTRLLDRVERGTAVTLSAPGHEDRSAALFTGMAGVAYALLRAASPTTVPDVLLITGAR